MMKIRDIFVFLLPLMICLSFALPARGEDTISGTYIEGQQKVSVKIQSWGDDCGPKPKSYSTKGGKKVTVQLKGDNLYFSDGSSTKKCWSANTRLKRLSATKKGNTWITTCETPANDSRFESGQYTVKAVEDGLVFINKSSYNWQLKQSICKAVITIKKNYTRSGAKKGKVKEPDLEKTEAGTGKCKTVGTMTRLAIAPSSVKLEAGEKICFSSYGVDSKGCRIPVSTSFSMSGPKGKTDSVLEKNCFTAGTNAALSEGKFRITATSNDGMHATAKVEVIFGSIEDLIAVNLDPSNLSGEGKEGSFVPQAMPPSGFIEIKDEGREGSRIWIFVIPIAALGILGGIIFISISLVKVRAARRRIKQTVLVDETGAAAIEADVLEEKLPSPAPVAAVTPPVAAAAPVEKKDKEDKEDKNVWMHCSVCRRDFEPGSMYCPYDGTTLKPFKEFSYRSAKGGLICPVCRRGYQKDATVCPVDKVYLVPYSVFRSQKPEGKAAKTKICPTCQKKYDESEMFCGSDGTKLEPIQ